MPFFYAEKSADGRLILSGDEHHHARRVMRLNAGDRLTATDGAGHIYEATICHEGGKDATVLNIVNDRFVPPKAYRLHIGISPTKNIDRTEFCVEKCVEMGIDHISFLYTEHSERKQINKERMQRLVISAAKQSQKVRLPLIDEIHDWQEVLSLHETGMRLIAALAEDSKPIFTLYQPVPSYLVLIGPEGDFSQKEVESAKNAGFSLLSLGTEILRTETAAMVACHSVHLLNEIHRQV